MYISNKYDFGLRNQFSKMLWHRKDKRGVISISKTDRKFYVRINTHEHLISVLKQFICLTSIVN